MAVAKSQEHSGSPGSMGTVFGVCILLVVAVFLVFSQTLRYEFVFDDAAYVYKNPAVTGGLSLSADVHVDIVSLKKADFEFAFGQYDNYIRAEGAGSILVFDVTTRAFFGKTCDANLVKWIDPQLDELFANLNNWPAVSTNHPLIGYYTMADGDVILNRIVDIPDSVVTKITHRGINR